MDYIEKLICKWLIKRIKKNYGADCPDYEPECVSCRAKKCIKFLEENINLLEEF